MTDTLPDEESAPRSTLQLVTDRSFGPFFLGLFVSNVGTWFHNVAVSIVMFDLTGSTLAVAVVSAIQFGAVPIVAPVAGWLADVVDRRRLLAATLSCSGLGAALLAGASVAGHLTPMVIYVSTAVLGAGNAGTHPVLQAVMPSLVPVRDLSSALGLHSVSFNLARAFGPALGAASLVAFGPTTSFVLDAASYVAFIIAILSIPTMRSVGLPPGARGSLMDGVRYARSDRVAFGGLLAIAAVGWASDPVQSFVPAIATDLGGGEGTVGGLISVFGVGAVAMAVSQGRVIRTFGGARAGAYGLAVLGGFLGVLALRAGIVVTAAGFAGSGAGFMLAITGITTSIQLRVPQATRGRVMALWSIAFLGTRPLTSTFNGLVADNVSLGIGLLIPAFVAAATAALVWRLDADDGPVPPAPLGGRTTRDG